jgi:hypothetical protein
MVRTSQPPIGKTCYQLGSNIFQIYSSQILGCRFVSVVLVYDVKISQPGRKNLAVRFNLISLIHTKLVAAPKTPSPVARRSAKSCERRGIDIRNGAPRNLSMPSKLIRPFSSMVSIVDAGYSTKPSGHQSVGKQLSNNLRIILQMDTTAQSIAVRTMNRTSQRARRRGETESRERAVPRCLLLKHLARNVPASSSVVAIRTFTGLMSSADALAEVVPLRESQHPLPIQAIGVEVNSPWQRGSFMGCFQVRSRERFPISQNVGKRDCAVMAALGLFQKADCDRLGDRVARG